MKKLLVFILVLLFSITCFVACSGNNDSGPDYLTFNISDDGTYAEVATCLPYTEQAVIPDTYQGLPVKSIGDGAFSDCSFLKSVTVPDSVTSIGDEAFRDCHSLASVNIPDGVTSIGKNAFKNCNFITSVTIPEGIESISDGAFAGCDSLTSVTIPDSVTSISAEAFKRCTSLTSIDIPDSVTSIGDNAFSECTSLANVNIPDGVTSISNELFCDCTSLVSIVIHYGVTSIGNSAFSGCTGLTNVTIPNSVTSIGAGAFSGCDSLAYYEYDNAYYLGNTANPYLVLVTAKEESFSACEVNANTKIILGSAFLFKGGLTSVAIPESVTSIGKNAFKRCSLTNIYYGGTTLQWNEIIKGTDWDYDAGEYTVVCTDGTLSK